MLYIHAKLIGIYRYVGPRHIEVCMTFQNLDNENELPFQIDIFNDLSSTGVHVSQKFINRLQKNLQGKKFLIQEDNDNGVITIVNLHDRIRECRS